MKFRSLAFLAACAAVLSVSSSPCAFAALGLPATSIALDGSPIQSSSSLRAQSFAAHVQSLASSSSNSYSVRSVQSGSVAVSEYVNTQSGQVFAVRWNGPSMPNLRQILSVTHFDALRAAAAQKPSPGLGGVSSIQTSDLVYEAYGHMGDFAGYAYQPSIVPQGFNPSTLAQ